MKKKIALITGITGQDGSYLARFLLKKNYYVIGMIRRSSSFNTARINDLHDNRKLKNSFKLFYGDLTDETSVQNIIKKTKPNEIYNLGAQSHVAVSFENPIYTANVSGLSTLKILEAIKNLGLHNKCKFYQASTSEMFGNSPAPQSEKTTFKPNSPYAAAKLYAHEITRIYREGFNMFACSGILFNHESEVRGETFVTKKIAKALVRMWRMLQQKKPKDLVIATGKSFTVKQFILEASKVLNLKITFKGKGINERGYDKNGKIIIKINKKYFRPLEVNDLRGNASQAFKELKWRPRVDFKELVKKMVLYDVKKESIK